MNHYILSLLLGLFLLTVCACDSESGAVPVPATNPAAPEIDEYLRGLPYDPVALLNQTEAVGGAARRTETGSTSDPGGYRNGYRTGCTTKTFELGRNFNAVSILRPTSGIVYPGGLVTVGADLARTGVPLSMALEPAPVTLRVDLPGIGEAGRFTLDRPTNANYGVALDAALDSWNANAAVEDYANASRSEYEASEAFSSQQLGIDVGMNVAWASNSVSSQLSVDQNSNTRTAVVAYKQIFYTVTANVPRNPSDLLARGVTLEQVQRACGPDGHLGYVGSVDYGRIILFRLETSYRDRSVDLKAVMDYAAGGTNASGSLAATYDDVLRNSTIKIITIGGNAEAAARVLTDLAAGPGALTPLIADNAVYGPDNPGVPIAYKINLARDNQVVSMGYTTDYSTRNCAEVAYNHPRVTLHNRLPVGNVRVHFRFSHDRNSKTKTKEQVITDQASAVLEDIPDGAYNVSLVVERKSGFAWREWRIASLGSYVEERQKETCWEIIDNGILNSQDILRKCR